MHTFCIILGIVIAACSAFATNQLLRTQTVHIPLSFWYLFWFLPFLAGGFHTYMAAITVIILFADLCRLVYTRRHLNIGINLSSVTCIIIVLGYCITPLWAADRGMAVWGILRYCPVLLLSFLLMQYPENQKKQFFALIPVCGAVMTVAGCILWCIPATRDFVAVNGRLSGFLQYPNTFAAFLLTGVAVLGMNPPRRISGLLLGFVLVAGILLSGSRTSIVLLAVLLPAIFVLKNKKAAGIVSILTAIVVVSVFCLIKKSDQITFLGRDIGSLFVRILYYKDAFPVILQHPFGLGYMGYRALETTFQTSRYTVSFVHSSFLQLLLDIGWIPALLFLICILKLLFSNQKAPINKLVLMVLTGHSLIDFDMQFFLFWAILLLCIDSDSGAIHCLRKGKIPGIMAAVTVFVLCAWLGLGDFFYQSGNYEKALNIAPFHTDSLAAALKTTSDPDELDRLSDRILDLNPTHSLAYSAKANAAFSRGNITEMIHYKENAIKYAPYSIAEYCDYIEKLYIVMELYVKSGDHDSAAFCLEKILAMPEKMEAVASKTDPLARRTGNNTEMYLPDSYLQLLDALAQSNS